MVLDNAAPGRLEGAGEIWADARPGRLDLLARHGEVGELNAIEACRELEQDLVAAGADLLDDGRHGLTNVGSRLARARQQQLEVTVLGAQIEALQHGPRLPPVPPKPDGRGGS